MMLTPDQSRTAADLRRRDRYSRRDVLRRRGALLARRGAAPSWKRTALCGRAAGPVEVHRQGEATYAVGVATCASVWACPVCSDKIRQGRTADVSALKAAMESRGVGRGVLLTLTIRHQRSDSLASLVDGLCEAWRVLQRRASWSVLRGDLAGQVRALEVTYGGYAGWHPHLHLFLVPRAGVDRENVLTAARGLEWGDVVAGVMGEAHRPNEAGLDARECSTGEYVTKLQYEMVRADLKRGRGRSVVPFDLPGRGWWGLWDEYTLAMSGRRAVQWSRGLRDYVGLNREVSDEDLAAPVGGGVVAVYDPRTWNRAWRGNRVPALLEAASRAALLAVDRRHQLVPLRLVC